MVTVQLRQAIHGFGQKLRTAVGLVPLLIDLLIVEAVIGAQIIVMEKYNREEFEEVMIDIGRVTKVVKGGRRFRFTG